MESMFGMASKIIREGKNPISNSLPVGEGFDKLQTETKYLTLRFKHRQTWLTCLDIPRFCPVSALVNGDVRSWATVGTPAVCPALGLLCC